MSTAMRAHLLTTLSRARKFMSASMSKELSMKTTLLMATLCTFAIAPSLALACEYNDASMASASSPERPGVQPAPEASKAPVTAIAKAAPKVVKPVASTRKTTAGQEKIAAATAR
jgi:hypothetical protein